MNDLRIAVELNSCCKSLSYRVILRQRSYCLVTECPYLALCLQWYSGLITSDHWPSVTKLHVHGRP